MIHGYASLFADSHTLLLLTISTCDEWTCAKVICVPCDKFSTEPVALFDQPCFVPPRCVPKL